MTPLGFLAARRRLIIGNVHLLPLPGSASYEGNGLSPIVDRALTDSRVLDAAGLDAILIQNNGDWPTHTDGLPETIAYMTMIGSLIRREVKAALGVNILSNGTESVLAVAHAVDARFVRIKVYVGAVVSVGGIIQGSAHRAQAFVRKVGASDVEIAADVYDRSSRPLGDMPIDDAAVQAVNQGKADALIITGSSLVQSLERAQSVKRRVSNVPVLLGGGSNAENVAQALAVYDGVIVGKTLKLGPDAKGPIARERVMAYMDAVHRTGAR